MNYSTLSNKELIELFSQKDFNVELLKLVLTSNNNITYPFLPEILNNNNKLDCLETYFNYLVEHDKEYLIIHFFSKPENISTHNICLAQKYIDNVISILIDQMHIDSAIDLANKYPEKIQEQCLIKFIKIYETNQSHFFDIPKFETLENIIVLAFDYYNAKDKLFSYINNITPTVPFLIKLANHSYQQDTLVFLDNYFKSHCPNYMENYIEKVVLNRTLNNKLLQKNKVNHLKI